MQPFFYAYVNESFVMNTPRRLNEIGLCTMAFAWSDSIPETNHHSSRNRLGSSTQVGGGMP